MLFRTGIAIGLLIATAAEAAEPAAQASPAARPAAAPVSTVARTPLKLQVGDVRKYMMPRDFQAAVNAPDPDKSTIVVEGERETPPLKSELPQPQGLGAVYSLFRHPTSAWRLFLPDPRAPEAGRPDVVPAREFRWGP